MDEVITPGRENHHSPASTSALCIEMALSLSLSQSTYESEQEALGALPLPAAPQTLRSRGVRLSSSQQRHAPSDQDNEKLGLFLAAAMGTISLMAAVYCVYNRFYRKKHQYLHHQLHDDPELTLDPPEHPPLFLHGSIGGTVQGGRGTGYGSVCDTPSIITVPPTLSPPPSVMPFPPLFLSSHSLRTISAKDLEKSFI